MVRLKRWQVWRIILRADKEHGVGDGAGSSRWGTLVPSRSACLFVRVIGVIAGGCQVGSFRFLIM